MKRKILHIATDYPDKSNPNTTKAVFNLLQTTEDKIEHIVISIQRKSWSWFKIKKNSDLLFEVYVPKIPFGILSDAALIISAIYFKIKFNNELRRVDIVHAHKLTIDGVFGDHISKLIKKPLVISIRGATDCKWIKYKIFSRSLYKNIVQRSEIIFWVSCWAKKYIHLKLKIENDELEYKSRPLPNICFTENKPKVIGDKKEKFLFVGRLDEAEWKGLFNLIDVVCKVDYFKLDVIGSGSKGSIIRLKKYIEQKKIESRVKMLGYVNQKEMQNLYENYIALLLPSYPETFGMVVVEALKSGTPVLIVKKSSIDGFIKEDVSYIKKVIRRNIGDLELKMIDLYGNQKIYKDDLLFDIENGVLEVFEKKTIGLNYINVIENLKVKK